MNERIIRSEIDRLRKAGVPSLDLTEVPPEAHEALIGELLVASARHAEPRLRRQADAEDLEQGHHQGGF